MTLRRGQLSRIAAERPVAAVQHALLRLAGARSWRATAMAACGALVLAGLIVVGLAVKGLAGNHPGAGDFGVDAASSPATDSPAGSPASGSRATRRRAQPGQLGQSARPGTGGQLPVVAGKHGLHGLAPPTRIQIPALEVVSSVSSVASVGGRLSVPADPLTVGWWPGAALPGSSSGAVVLDGHVDSATRGLGAFFRLTGLRAGDAIILTTLGGGKVTYRVAARRSYAKATGLPADLFANDGPPRLVLITCGGQFDAAALHYQDNVVIFARPVSSFP